MVIGSHCTPTDILPVQLEGGPIEIVQEFTYLGSSISKDGEVKGEVKCRIGKAARAFGCLHKPIFQNHRLSVETKRKVYRAVVLSVLLYGAETWAIKAESVRRLSGFLNRCYSGSQHIPTVEGEIIIERVGSGFWDGGNDGTPLDETASVVAWSPSPHGALSYA